MRTLVLLFVTASFSIVSAQPRTQPSKTAAPAASKPKFKAIWEPVNFKKDIDLKDVDFISAGEGWAIGEKNTIIHTKDGGRRGKSSSAVILNRPTPGCDRCSFLMPGPDGRAATVTGYSEPPTEARRGVRSARFRVITKA